MAKSTLPFGGKQEFEKNKRIKMEKSHTKVSLGRWSTVGVSPLQTSATWARTLSCQVGLLARSMEVHVSRRAVVSWPAKKKVLHSSMIS